MSLEDEIAHLVRQGMQKAGLRKEIEDLKAEVERLNKKVWLLANKGDRLRDKYAEIYWITRGETTQLEQPLVIQDWNAAKENLNP